MSDSPIRTRGPITEANALERLGCDEIEPIGRMPYSSNATFLVDLVGDGETIQAIYKPVRGERPLWDFPSGLAAREAAAYRMSAAMAWDLVPPTILREGPHGPGSLQLFIPCDYEHHYFTMLEDAEHHETLRRLCVFDVIINSTDRKGGHCLLDDDGHVWAIDNGLSFHQEFKLRTVIWDWAGDDLPVDIIDDLCSLLDGGVPDDVSELLDPFEREAILARTRSLVAERRFPIDPTGRRYPWPVL